MSQRKKLTPKKIALTTILLLIVPLVAFSIWQVFAYTIFGVPFNEELANRTLVAAGLAVLLSIVAAAVEDIA